MGGGGGGFGQQFILKNFKENLKISETSKKFVGTPINILENCDFLNPRLSNSLHKFQNYNSKYYDKRPPQFF